MLPNKIQSLLPEIIKIRQTIHANPELKYEEHATAALVAATLKKYGYEVTEKIAGTGVSAILDSGKPGKTVALRADMDALPIVEQTGLPYSSKNPGKMHACGHDGHTATLLAVAGALKDCKEQFKGKIKFIFQPAEEGGAGAAAMIKAGILENPKVDAIFGYHNYSIPFKKIGIRYGCLLASSDYFIIKIYGKGAHAALPSDAIDPIYAGSLIIQALQSVISRTLAPTSPAVLSITEFHAGTGMNIIPEEATLTGTLRTTSPEARSQAIKQLQQIVTGVAQSLSAKATVEIVSAYPATMNSYAETELVLQTARQLYGEENCMHLSDPIMATEDFAFYLEKIPGCYFVVGNDKENGVVHTATYVFQDDIIPIAAQLLAQTAINFLTK